MGSRKDSESKSRLVCPVITPGSIPNFWIPPKISELHNLPKNKESKYQKPLRISDEVWSESDPGFNLSMTLEHIPKAVTPYGFYFPEKSPISMKRESLLLAADNKERKQQMFKRNSYQSEIVKEGLKSRVSIEANSCESMETFQEGVSPSSSADTDNNAFAPHATFEHGSDLAHRSISSTMTAPSSPRIIKMSPMFSRVTKMPRMSTDVERSEAINQLHMLCASQFFDSRTRDFMDLGDVELELHYDRRCRRLHVHVVRANGIALKLKRQSSDINTYVEVCLMPDRQQAQRTWVCKGTCDPIFNEHFSFHMSPCDLLSRVLRVRVYHSSGLLLDKRLASCIGELRLNLKQLKCTPEKIFIQEDLQKKDSKEGEGMLNVSVCYRSKTRKLCITVVRAQNLPKIGLLKCAHNYRAVVKVTQVKNNAIATEVKRTSLRSRTQHPIFKQEMSFEISDLNNLRDGMAVVVTLRSEDLTRKPKTLGTVRLGLGSSRNTEKQQWKNVLRNPALPIIQWHAV